MYNASMNYKYIGGFLGAWSCLGFKRGMEYYDYMAKQCGKQRLYIDRSYNGLFGAIMYANPMCIPFTMHKELYRLEVNVRNLEKEKESKKYNDLL